MSVIFIDKKTLKQKINSGANLYLVDVREPEELQHDGFIEGSINIPLMNVGKRIIEIAAHKGEEIIIICRSGARASTAAKILLKAGLPNVQVLEGGMLDWDG